MTPYELCVAAQTASHQKEKTKTRRNQKNKEKKRQKFLMKNERLVCMVQLTVNLCLKTVLKPLIKQGSRSVLPMFFGSPYTIGMYQLNLKRVELENMKVPNHMQLCFLVNEG